MRSLLLVIAFFSLGLVQINAQTEIKINPLGLLFGSPDVSAEFGLGNSAGIEPFIGFTSRKFLGGDVKLFALNTGASFKYYFNPQRGVDRFYAGAYTRFNTGTLTDNLSDDEGGYKRLSLGLLIGQKWVSKKNIVFELALGVGRAFVNKVEEGNNNFSDVDFDLDIMTRLAVGYRFGGSNN